MKLTYLEVEKFLSVHRAKITLDGKGLVLIQGLNEDEDTFESNGAGKSTLFSEAPTWCLFGETIRGHKGDKVVNRNYKKDARVALGLEDDNGDQYDIIRHRKHKEHKNHVLLYRNGENITGKSDKDTDQMIIDLLQMDFITFTNSIMFGQGLNKMFALATDSEQKKILERMLQIDIFRACQERAKQYISLTEQSISELNTFLNGLNKEKQSTVQSIQELQDKEAELGEKIANRIGELRNQIVEYEEKIQGLEDAEGLQLDIWDFEVLVSKVNDKLQEFDKYVEHRNTLEGDERSLKREYDNLERQLTRNIQKLRDIRVGKNIPKNCSECGQSLPLEDTSHIENHLENSIEKLENECELKMNELTETRDLLNQVSEHLKGREKHEKSKQLLKDNIRDIQEQIRTIDNQAKHYNKMILSLENQIAEQEDLLGTTYTDLIETAIRKVEDLDIDIYDASGRINDLVDQLQTYNFWANAYGNQGIKSVLLDSVTPYLNTRANYYLSKLSGSSIEVKFNTQQELKSGEKRDKFSVEVVNDHGDDNYGGNSGGEKRRIDIAINMALQDLVSSRSNKSLDIVVYDEVYEGLDEVGCQAVIELLREKAEVFGSVFVITHNDSLKQMFTKSIKVEKSDGETKVYEQAV